MAISMSKDDQRMGYNSTGSGSANGSSSFIGKSVSVDGEIKSEENITIEGKVKGKINVGTTVTIGNDGFVNAEIKAREVRILGKAEGNIQATQRVEIVAGGQFIGNIQSEKIVIQEGAIFKGNINMEEIPGKSSPSVSGSVSHQPENKDITRS